MSRRKFSGVAALLVAFLLLSEAAHAISWSSSLSFALQQAKKLRKPIMVDFYTDWCGWCRKLDNETFSNMKVNSLSTKFICVKINGDNNPDLVKKYGVSGYPTVIFLNPDGNVLAQNHYMDAAAFAKQMEQVLAQVARSGAAKAPAEKPAAPAAKQKPAVQPQPAKPVSVKPVKLQLVYNGYIDVPNEDFIVQINYGIDTYFLKRGETFRKYKVLSADKEKVVLQGEAEQVVLEFKKPVEEKEIADRISYAAEKFKKGLEDYMDREDVGSRRLNKQDMEALLALGAPLAGFFIFFLLLYIYFAVCLQVIAKKTETGYGWLAWIPIIHIFLMCRIGKVNFLWILALLVPLVNIFVSGYIFYKIAKARGKAGLWGILVGVPVIPVLNLIALGYLAFSK